MSKLSAKEVQFCKFWAPVLIKAVHGIESVDKSVTLTVHGIPAPQEESGGFRFDLGAFEFTIRSGPAHDWLSSRITQIGEHRVLFPEPVPRIFPVVGGLSLKWGKPPRIVTSLLTRLVGATIEEVLLFDTHAEIRVGNGPDQEIDWSA